MRARSFLPQIIALLSLIPGTSRAITLDEFLGDASATSSSPGVPAIIVTSSTSAVGGNRTLYSVKNSAGAGITRLETFPDPEFSGDPDSSLGYTQGAHTGQGVVTWDGDSNGSSVIANGLGSIDLTQDGATAVLLGIKFFDFPSQNSIDVTIRLFDATNAAGSRYSDVTVTLNRALFSENAIVLTIPFSTFLSVGQSAVPASDGSSFPAKTTFGQVGSVSLQSVGAAQLILNGLTNSNAPDLVIDFLSTNGRCPMVPNAQGRVVDECGVCLDNQHANKGKDTCGLCLAGPPGYTYSPVTDACGLCPQAPGYGNAKDPCGVCFGDGSTCADCAGTPNGVAKLDQCGVCGGNGTSCLDCAGTMGGTKTLDLCGVCGGDGKSCFDCSGVMFGPAVSDVCGVCGGSVTKPEKCPQNSPACTTVPATKKVKKYQKTLESKAKTLFKKYQEESNRNRMHGCEIDQTKLNKQVTKAYNTIVVRSKTIFSKGVQVCGTSCVTVSYAQDVKKLTPQFKTLEKATKQIAWAVNRCYIQKGIPTGGVGAYGTQSTIDGVRDDLNKLVKECKNTKVCK